MSGLVEHLAGGVSTTCFCWEVVRRDGVRMGFTDHDRDLAFGGVVFRAGTGLTARALQQVAGLAVDNSEAAGALSDEGIAEADLRAGRFDGAAVTMWLVNWADPEQRMLRFAGSIGEVAESDGAFRAELRGLTDGLNRVQGRVIQSACDAVLGDARCGVALEGADYGGAYRIVALRERRVLVVAGGAGFAAGFFARGLCRFTGGAAAGLSGDIKTDRFGPEGREIELWQEPGALPAVGDAVDLRAGCDRTAATCRTKFANFANFRGFPDVPREDWIVASPPREVAAGRGG